MRNHDADFAPTVRTKRRCAFAAGFSLHADTYVPQGDRKALERLLRYGARPAFSQTRLSMLANGNVCYRLRKPYFTGQTEVVLPPVAFLRRLASLIPPPRTHMVRFAGAFAPNANIRSAVVALAPAATDPRPPSPDAQKADADQTPRSRRYRMLWAALLKRVFAKDVLTCPDCQGRMKLIATITTPDAIEAILRCVGLPTKPPTIADARAPPQTELCFDDFIA